MVMSRACSIAIMIFYLDNRQDIVNEWEHTEGHLLYIKHINIYLFISVFIIISGS